LTFDKRHAVYSTVTSAHAACLTAVSPPTPEVLMSHRRRRRGRHGIKAAETAATAGAPTAASSSADAAAAASSDAADAAASVSNDANDD
jgi:hypothetical protein